MKYCTKCGNQLEDEMLFCQKCGTQCYQEVYTNNTEPNDYREYWGLSYKDIESGRTISLTPDGIHIYKKSFIPLMSTRADKIIPYSEVIDVVSKRATALSSGYISIITATDGVDQKANRTMLLQDTNTALFKRKNEPEIERIYRAIRDICNLGSGTYEGTVNSLSNQPKPTNTKMVALLIPIIAVLLIFAIISSNKTNNSSTNEVNTESGVNIIHDVSKYANISSEELISLLGNPDDVSDTTCQGAFNVPCKTFFYDNADGLGEVSFDLVNNSVVMFTAYNTFPYQEGDSILTRFGLAKGENCAVDDSSNEAIRYRCPTENVDDFWISLIDGDTFGFLKVTYDMFYYEEWYMPIGSSEEVDIKTDTEITVKSLMKSPKSADFPWYDWKYGKNPFYIGVSSYVDAQNSFGAEVRSEFYFVYTTSSHELIYAIFDGEVIVDNGYVPTEKLVMQLAYGEDVELSETAYSSDNVTEYDYGTEQSETEYSAYDAAEYDDYSEETYYEDDDFNYSNDDLEYMREIAEMEWRNEFTSEEIIIEDYEEPERDLDGIVTHLSPEEYEEMQNSAMGE